MKWQKKLMKFENQYLQLNCAGTMDFNDAARWVTLTSECITDQAYGNFVSENFCMNIPTFYTFYIT
jgi:hypothetical protein